MSEAALLPEFEGFAANAREGRLAFPWCGACGRFHWYPMPRCPHCRAAGIAWKPVSGNGDVFSFTEVRHAFDKSRRGQLPYIVALVTFADAPGVRLVTNIIGADAADVRIGDAVAPVFPDRGDVTATVTFRRVRPAHSKARRA